MLIKYTQIIIFAKGKYYYNRRNKGIWEETQKWKDWSLKNDWRNGEKTLKGETKCTIIQSSTRICSENIKIKQYLNTVAKITNCQSINCSKLFIYTPWRLLKGKRYSYLKKYKSRRKISSFQHIIGQNGWVNKTFEK